MGKQYSPYIDDDEDVEWIEETAVEVFGSKSEVFRRAIKVLREEKGNEIESLVTDGDTTSLI